MKCRCFVRLVACVATVVRIPLRSDQVLGQPVVLESAELGAVGRIGGTSVTASQFVGWRFETSEPLAVERVGGHMLSFPDAPGEIFAALIRLQSITSVPMGTPFTTEEVVATTTFRPPFPSNEVFVPLEATLTPGSYTLVFGTGLFGATGAGALHNGDDQPDIPPTNISSFIFWSIPSSGQPFEWRLNLASHMRFVIEAHVINIPGDYNNDGKVDAADYVVWRKYRGTNTVLPNDPSGGTIGAAQFNTWRANFGNMEMAGSGGGSAANGGTVPEPSAIALLILALAALKFRRLFL